MNLKAFDKSAIGEYAEKARASWGGTPEYREFEEKDRERTDEEREALGSGMMDIFREFADVKDKGPGSKEAGCLVQKLQAYITENFYRCSDETLMGLGKMYGAGGEFTENIDKAAGEGTAAFAAAAIEEYFR